MLSQQYTKPLHFLLNPSSSFYSLLCSTRNDSFNPSSHLFLIINLMISSFRKLTAVALCLQTKPVYFSSDNWKDRDDAAEKVYISTAESNTWVI